MSKQQDSWKRESGYIWALLGSAVGFANVLAFSAQCYKNGGGAFLIPFLIAMLILGLPMLFLEGIIGKTYHLPLVSAYGKSFGSVGKFFGWLSIIACLTIGSFYTVLTAYCVVYGYYTATASIPWESANFFKVHFLQTQAV
jgi:NSS family neurotransmitter:Na+ symporter